MDNIISHLRRQKGLKQNDMAEALRISPSYLCKVEKGVQKPAKNFKRACSDFFGIPEHEIFFQKKIDRKKIGNLHLNSQNKLWLTRQQKGVKQFELAKMLNCSPSYLSKIEKGLQVPTSEFRKKCAQVLKKREADLFPNVVS